MQLGYTHDVIMQKYLLDRGYKSKERGERKGQINSHQEFCYSYFTDNKR
jgi:hypothetical protein